MPAIINHVYPPEHFWREMWAECDVDREIDLCGKREIAEHLLSVLATLRNPLIVEAGCGVGAWVLYLGRQGFANIVGIDNYAPALKQLDARGGRSMEGDIQHLPFADSSVDVCLSFGVVEHFLEGPAGCLREMERILIPGGYLFLSVPYLNWTRRLVSHPLRSMYIRLKRIQRRFSEYRFGWREIVEHCRNSGFEVIRCTTDDYLPRSMSLGLYADFPFLRGRRSDELNRLGRLICMGLRVFSPWLATGGILVIARKPTTEGP